jgi:hypothetical protein
MFKVRVFLMDRDNFTQHASGFIALEIIEDCFILERNNRTYVFVSFIDGIATYKESSVPYLVTEF